MGVALRHAGAGDRLAQRLGGPLEVGVRRGRQEVLVRSSACVIGCSHLSPSQSMARTSCQLPSDQLKTRSKTPKPGSCSGDWSGSDPSPGCCHPPHLALPQEVGVDGTGLVGASLGPRSLGVWPTRPRSPPSARPPHAPATTDPATGTGRDPRLRPCAPPPGRRTAALPCSSPDDPQPFDPLSVPWWRMGVEVTLHQDLIEHMFEQLQGTPPLRQTVKSESTVVRLRCLHMTRAAPDEHASEHASHRPVPRRAEARGGTGRIVVLPDSVHTAQLAADALGCEVGAIANSLLFSADEDGDQPLLLLTSGAHRVDTGKVAAELGIGCAEARQAGVRTTPHRSGHRRGLPLRPPGAGAHLPRPLAAAVRRDLGRRGPSRRGLQQHLRGAAADDRCRRAGDGLMEMWINPP